MTARIQIPNFIKRICNIQLMHLSLLMVLPVMLAEALRAPDKLFSDPDLWWHISNARILFTQHHFIWTEPYAFTVLGKQWVNPEWLAEVPFWLGFHHLGAFGVYLVTWGLIYANITLVYIRSGRGTGPEPAFWASLAALVLFTINAGARSILCGYILLSLLLLVLDLYETRRSRLSSRLIWLVPVIFCVWINTHGTWLIGLMLFAMYAVPGWFRLHAGVFEQDKRGATIQKTLLIVFALSIAALFLNPYGWHLVWNPFDMIFKQKLNIASIEEWQPLNLEYFVGRDSVVVIGIMLISGMLKGRKWKIYEILWVLFAWYAAFDHIRFTFLAGVIVTPFLARDFAGLIWNEQPKKEFPAMNGLFAVAALFTFIYMIPTPSRDLEVMNKAFPDSLIGMVQPSWRTFNEYELGGRFDFDGRRDFVDSRVDTFEHSGVFGDYIETINIKTSFEMLDKYKIDHILFREKTPFIYLVEHSQQWGVVKRDRDWVLLERKPELLIAQR
jgi:hypothetical protein